MEPPRWHDAGHQAPRSASFHGTLDSQHVSSSANLTEEDIIGGSTRQGWKLDEVMDARQAVAAAAASLQDGSDRDGFCHKPWPPQMMGGVTSLGAVVGLQGKIARATSGLPTPRMGTRHKKRKGADIARRPEGAGQGLADLADMASIFTTEASSKRAKVESPKGPEGPQKGSTENALAAAVAAARAAAADGQSPLPKAQPGQSRTPRKKGPHEELPFRSADGRWTCTFSTGGMNKNKLTLCSRDNEARRTFCKACKAPRWDWQLRGRIAAILQHRDLQSISLQQVMQELTKMSLLECEGLRFPTEAVKHEVNAFVSGRGSGAELRQPAPVGSLPVFPNTLRKKPCPAEGSQGLRTARTSQAQTPDDVEDWEVSIEDELATNFSSLGPALSSQGNYLASTPSGVGAHGMEAESDLWRPLRCSLLQLAHALQQQQPDQAAGSHPCSSSAAEARLMPPPPSNGRQAGQAARAVADDRGTCSVAEESATLLARKAAENCSAFAHALIEAVLARRWPSMLKLKSNMKDIQPRTLRFHMPFTNAAKVLGEAAGAAHAGTALPISAGLEPAEPVQALKRPLPFDSRAALLQDPPRRPKGWKAPPLPPPRLNSAGEPTKEPPPDTSDIEATSWLMAPPYSLQQVQHAFAPPKPAPAKPEDPAEHAASDAKEAETSPSFTEAEGQGSASAVGHSRPSFGQGGSAFRPAVARLALPAPDSAQAAGGISGPAAQTEETGPPQQAAEGDKEKPPEVIDYRKEWQRRLLQRLSQPDVPGLAGMEGLEHDAGLAFQAAAVLGVRQSVIESAISKFSALRQAQQI